MITDDLLIEATLKLIELDGIPEWKDELLSKAPPVLWFGDSSSGKPKIITIGANPSRWEFLDRSGKKSWPDPLKKSFYETMYLKKNRFYHLSTGIAYNDITKSSQVRKEIIKSYNNYFKINPYNWFGKNTYEPYNVEGFMRGLDASYFDCRTYMACHIDIFPFASISDFNKIQGITRRDILSGHWAAGIVDELLAFLRPELIVIFGRNNYNYFCNYFSIPESEALTWKAKFPYMGKCDYWVTNYNRFKVLGLSVNLGNPKGFNSGGLKDLGLFLRCYF
jgi:hypothetical protein